MMDPGAAAKIQDCEKIRRSQAIRSVTGYALSFLEKLHQFGLLVALDRF
jgi:hypothetical protein